MDSKFESNIPVGVIGGYGITDDISIQQRIAVETPFGNPSHPVIIGELGGKQVAFLSRHGKGREIPSHQINYRANMFALYRLGVDRVVTATANGSLRTNIAPGDIAIPADYIDETKNRPDTFFQEGPPRHFSSYEPFCPEIRGMLSEQTNANSLETHDDCTLVVIEGPRFATEAESRMYRQLGSDIIGGSTYPEVALARELEMCYGNFALITDHDNAYMIDDEPPVSLELIDDVLSDYAKDCTSIIEETVADLQPERCCSCTGHASKATSDDHNQWKYRRDIRK